MLLLLIGLFFSRWCILFQDRIVFVDVNETVDGECVGPVKLEIIVLFDSLSNRLGCFVFNKEVPTNPRTHQLSFRLLWHPENVPKFARHATKGATHPLELHTSSFSSVGIRTPPSL